MPEPEQAIVPDDQFAYFFLGRYDEALAQAEDILRGTPDGHAALRIGAASAAFAGQNETAQRLVSHLRAVVPSFECRTL